jgi:Tol biopolymer transport system component
MLSAGTRLGPYEILSPLGAGGMGEVYRARDPRLGRDVAIKVLPGEFAADPERLRRFEQETRAAGGLNHPSVLVVLDVGAANGSPYLVSELLEGETLRSVLDRRAPTARQALSWAIQIAQGLAAAQGAGIVHRDLKPDNLFVTKDGRVKILDFGLAKLRREDQASVPPTGADTTASGAVLGTASYMSPEQVRGLPVDHRSDIFSLGVVLYEMLSRERPFKRETSAETMAAILRQDPPELAANSGVSQALDRVVRRCLEKNPEERFHSAHDLAFALEAVSGSSRATAALVPTSAVRGKRALGAAALLAAVFAIGVLLNQTLRRAEPAPPPTYHRLTFDRGTMGRARFAPDGNTVVYNAAWSGEATEVFTTRLDSRESRSLGLHDAVVHAVSSTGELAVGLEATDPRWEPSTLARVPLAGGSPREVLQSITWADWSPDGTELAVVRDLGESGRAARSAAWRIEFPIGKVLYETKDRIGHLRVSPRGDWLAFIEHHPFWDTGGSLVAVDRSGAKRTLTDGWADLYGVAWRPDGREVWFTASREGSRDFKTLYAVTLEGKERVVARMFGDIDLEDIGRDGRVLLSHLNWRLELEARPRGASEERDLTWLGVSNLVDISRDGDRVLFGGYSGWGGRGAAYLRKTDGSPAVRLAIDVGAMTLSPDGKWALALRGSPPQLVLLPTGVGEEKTVAGAGRRLDSVEWATWFPDSRSILFTAEVNGQPSRAYAQDIEGGEPRPIGPEGLRRPLVSPDGRTLVARLHDQRVLLPVDGGPSRPCPGIEPQDRLLRWSADGRSIFIRRDERRAIQVYRLDVAGGGRTLLWELAPRDRAGVTLYHDNFNLRVTPDGKSYAYSFLRSLSELYLVEGLK